MAVTKSWESKVLATGAKAGAAPGRVGWREFSWLACSSVMVALGLLMVFSAKTQNFPELSGALARGELIDLNRVSKPEAIAAIPASVPGRSRARICRGQNVRLSLGAPAAPERGCVGSIALGAARAVAAARETEARVRGAHAGRISNAVPDLDRGIPGRFPYCVFDLAMERAARRLCHAARDSSVDRNRPDSRGEPARSVARYARVQQICVGRSAGLPGIACRRRCAPSTISGSRPGVIRRCSARSRFLFCCCDSARALPATTRK